MAEALRVLVVADTDEEMEALLRWLRAAGYAPMATRVDTPGSMRAALQGQTWDLILSRDAVPHFDCAAARGLVQELGLDLPCIVVDDPVSAGAREPAPGIPLEQLGPAVQREVREAQARRSPPAADQPPLEGADQSRRIVELAAEGIWVLDREGKTTYVNQQVADMLGYTREEMLGRHLSSFLDPADVPRADECIVRRAPGSTHRGEFRFRRKDGGEVWALVSTQSLTDPEGQSIGSLSMLTDITERKRVDDERAQLLAEAQEARRRAEEASAAKDRFLGVVSHELRNPLAAVLAGVDLLRHKLRQDEWAQRILEIIHRNVQIEARLISDLIDFTRIASSDLGMQRAPAPLDAVVRGAIAAAEPEASSAGLHLTSELQPGLVVSADASRLAQAVGHLLSNAIRFTPPGGQVHVRVWACSEGGQQPRTACVSVTDTGAGIPPDLMPRLFEAFERGEAGGWGTPGLGIGLAMVRRIVEAHGGRVWASSAGPGQGSCFTIELPLLEPASSL